MVRINYVRHTFTVARAVEFLNLHLTFLTISKIYFFPKNNFYILHLY